MIDAPHSLERTGALLPFVAGFETGFASQAAKAAIEPPSPTYPPAEFCPEDVERRFALNNPGGIRKSRRRWLGLSTDQPDARFFKFRSRVYGLRALYRVLMEIQDRGDLPTLRVILKRRARQQAPAPETWVVTLSDRLKVDPDTPFDLHDPGLLERLAREIIKFECGKQPYSVAEFREALLLAGVQPHQGQRGMGTGLCLIASAVGFWGLAALGLANYLGFAPLAELLSHGWPLYGLTALGGGGLLGLAVSVWRQ